MNDGYILLFPRGIAGDHDILTFWKGASDGVEGLAAHHDGVAGSLPFEELQVFGEVPRQVSILSDDAVGRHRDDGGEGHTATGALMCGWDW